MSFDSYVARRILHAFSLASVLSASVCAHFVPVSKNGVKSAPQTQRQLTSSEKYDQLIDDAIGLKDQSKFDQSEQLIEKAKQIAQQMQDRSRVAYATSQLGELYRVKEKPTKAIEILLSSERELATSPSAEKYLVYVLKNLGLSYLEKADYVSAREYARRTSDLAEKLHDQRATAWSLYISGHIGFRTARYDEALKALNRAREILTTQIQDESVLEEVLSLIAAININQGNNREAYRLIQQAISIAKRLNHPRMVSRFLGDVGAIFHYQGDFDRALEYYQESVRTSERINEQRYASKSLFNMSILVNELGRHHEALEYLLSALPKSIAIEDKHGILLTEEELGSTYMYLGRYAEAFQHLNKVLTEIDHNDDYHRSTVLCYLGRLNLLQGNYPAAIDYLDQAASMGLRTNQYDMIFQPLMLKGRAYFLQKDYKRATETLTELIKHVELTRTLSIGDEEQRAFFFQSGIVPYHIMVDVMLAQNNSLWALSYAERARARVLLEALQGGKQSIHQFMTANEKQTESHLNSRLSTINIKIDQEITKANASSQVLTGLKAEQQTVRTEYESFRTEIYEQHPAGKTQQEEFRPFDEKELDELLPDTKTAALEYVITDEGLKLFVLTKNENQKASLNNYKIAIDNDKLTNKINALRKIFSTRDPDYESAAKDLYQLLLTPAESQLRDKSTILIVPDGALWEAPFQALISPATERFVVEDHAVCILPSLGVLRELLKKASDRRQFGLFAQRELLAIGNPARRSENVSSDKEEKLCTLAHAEEEVKTIASLFDPHRVKVFIGKSALEETIKAEAGSFRILHFATHALLDDHRPMYSRIFLSCSTAANDEDGSLEASEIAELSLHADLVVLSACETALGRISRGEGMLGMTWAFSLAGAPTVVASQWKVESSSTSDLMVNFYRNLMQPPLSGKPHTKVEALQRAQLALLKEGKYRHPFYWAPFVMVGNGLSSIFSETR